VRWQTALLELCCRQDRLPATVGILSSAHYQSKAARLIKAVCHVYTEAEQPEDWDEEEDGEWEPPRIPNPKCEDGPGCGEWERPTIPNSDYKGTWYPSMIDNPEYKVDPASVYPPSVSLSECVPVFSMFSERSPKCTCLVEDSSI